MNQSVREESDRLVTEMFNTPCVTTNPSTDFSLEHLHKLYDQIKVDTSKRLIYTGYKDYFVDEEFLKFDPIPASYPKSEEITEKWTTKLEWCPSLPIFDDRSTIGLLICDDGDISLEYSEKIIRLSYHECKNILRSKGRKKLRGKKIKMILTHFMKYEKVMGYAPTFSVKHWRLTELKRKQYHEPIITRA